MLRNVCDIMWSQGRRTFLAFQDVSKAYDVWREGLWMKMREFGVLEEFVNVYKSLYDGVR